MNPQLSATALEKTTVKKFGLLLVLVALGAGCHGIHRGVPGSGKLLKQTRTVAPFTSISTEGAFDIEVVCQKPQEVQISGDDNILPLVSTEVSNNVLHVRNLQNYSTSQPLALRISIPDLTGISSSGAGNFEVSGLKNDKFEIDVSGAPTIIADGETRSLKIDASGAGKIDTHKLRAARVKVDSKGVSGIEVYAGEQLDATVSGPSYVIYRGNPVVNKTVNGPGSVEKKESTGS
jgi:hypothetical protein